MSLSIGILGTGVGALTLALACHKAGLRNIRLYENGAYSEDRGVILSPNASRVLRALGCLDPITAIASMARSDQIRSSRSGLLISNLPLGQFAQRRYGAPFMQLLETDLCAVLGDAVRQFGISIISDPSAEIADPGHLTGQHDLLVRTSGVSAPLSARSTAPNSLTLWRGLVPVVELPASLQDTVVAHWFSPGACLSTYHVDGDQSLYCQLAITDSLLADKLTHFEGDLIAGLEHATPGWHPAIQKLFACAKSGGLESTGLEYQDMRWQPAQPVPLGDAISGQNFLPQATALAIEDAWVLSRMLDNYEDSPKDGIQQYIQYRQPRRRRVYQAAFDDLYEATQSNTKKVFTRNLRMGLTSRYLPELALKPFDQLFQYDCIKGFH